MKFFLYLFFYTVFTIQIHSVPSVEEIQKITMEDLPKVASWVKDKKTSPRFRVMILERLNILLLENRSNLNSSGKPLIELFSNLINENANQGSSYTLVIRKKTCLMLGYFHRTNSEADAYELIKSQIELDTDGDAAASCIRSLGEYGERKDLTSKFLSKVLEKSMKKKKINEDDVEIALAALEVLQSFRLKQSNLVLMKILDSKYPNDVKNLAKKTLESIPQ
jgi:hypothetical protein